MKSKENRQEYDVIIAEAAMAFSSITVVTNANLLRRVKL